MKHGQRKEIITAPYQGKQAIAAHIKQVYLGRKKGFKINIALSYELYNPVEKRDPSLQVQFEHNDFHQC